MVPVMVEFTYLLLVDILYGANGGRLTDLWWSLPMVVSSFIQ